MTHIIFPVHSSQCCEEV